METKKVSFVRKLKPQRKMKKNTFLSSLILMLILIVSCSENPVIEDQTNIVVTDKSLTSKSGDGMYDLLGAGYDVTKKFANPESAGFQVIDIERFKTEQAGRLVLESLYSSELKEDYAENAESYSRGISSKTDATAKFKVYGVDISASFKYSKRDSTHFDSKYIYGSCSVLIKQRRSRMNTSIDLLKQYLTPEFVADLQSKTAQQIVRDYGTHVLVDIYTGAKLDIMYQSETTNDNRVEASKVGVKVNVSKYFDVNTNTDVNTSSASKNINGKLHYTTRGGDPSKSLVGDINVNESTTKLNISGWQNSSTPSNSVLVDIAQSGLVNISDLIDNPTKKTELINYNTQYLADNTVVGIDIPEYLYSYKNDGASMHYLDFSTNLQPTNYWINEGPNFKAFKYKAENTIPIYGYKSTVGWEHYYAKVSTLQPTSYWNQYMGVCFYAYSEPGPGRTPVYSYKASSDHYFAISPSAGSSYWTKEGIAFYAPL